MKSPRFSAVRQFPGPVVGVPEFMRPGEIFFRELLFRAF
jgi:hypothetical protein